MKYCNCTINQFKVLPKTQRFEFRYIIWFECDNIVKRGTFQADVPLKIDFDKKYNIQYHLSNQNNIIVENIEEEEI